MAESAWLTCDLRLPFGDLHPKLSLREDRVTLTGPSGSGKSTLLRVLAGVERRARGHLWVDGECWQDSESGVFKEAPERRVGWAPQAALLLPHLSVAQNIGLSPRAADVAALARGLRIEHLLTRRPRFLSGGEAQRVALARSMAGQPRLLLLDEPFSALNEELRSEITAFVSAFCSRQGVRLVLATHESTGLHKMRAHHGSTVFLD